MQCNQIIHEHCPYPPHQQMLYGLLEGGRKAVCQDGVSTPKDSIFSSSRQCENAKTAGNRAQMFTFIYQFYLMYGYFVFQ